MGKWCAGCHAYKSYKHFKKYDKPNPVSGDIYGSRCSRCLKFRCYSHYIPKDSIEHMVKKAYDTLMKAVKYEKLNISRLDLE